MTEWRETTLGDVLTLQRGFDLPARDRIDGPYPIVSSSGITGRHAVAKVEPPGVVIGRYGSLGSVHWLAEPYWPHNTALWVKDFKGNDPRFTSYLLRTISHDGSAAAAVPGVNRNHLHALPVRVPEVRVQRQIAAVLAAFDERIAINERRIELLEDVVRSLYREWFVRFRFPGHVTRSSDASSQSLPEGWCFAPLADMASDERWAISSGPFGSKLGRKDYVETGVPVIRGTNLAVGGGFTDDGYVFVSEAKADTLRSSIAFPGDIIVTQRGTLGQVGLVPSNARFPRYVISQSQMKITTDTQMSTQYLYAALRSPEAVRAILSMAISSGVPHINLALLRGMTVVVPPVEVQNEFESTAAPIGELIEHHIAMSARFACTRDLLLPRLVTGRLDTADIDLGNLLPEEIAA
jgi:type I restriction enzyme S subunit